MGYSVINEDHLNRNCRQGRGLSLTRGCSHSQGRHCHQTSIMGNSRAFKGNTMDVILVVKIINRQMEYVDDPLGMGRKY